MHGLLARLRPFCVFFVLGLAVLSLSRLGLSTWHGAQVADAHGWAAVLLQGLRVDVATLCLLYGLPAALALLLPEALARSRWTRRAIAAWLTFGTCLLVFMELATPAFMEEYGLRPNRLFVEYLVYPREVASTLAKGHLPSVLIVVVALAACAWGCWRLALRSQQPVGPVRWWARTALAAAVVLASALGVRSTLGHRPLNPAMVAFSTDPTVNVLPLNSLYSVAQAARDWLGEDPGAKVYGALPFADVVAVIRREAGIEGAVVNEAIPTLAAHTPAYRGPPRNLVIVLEESLGAQFIGSLGGKPLSPRFDQLSTQGWAFDHLYATGTRSVRGIEAALTGFTPTPAEAVVKLPKAQHDFFTLTELLRRHGYDTTFYYGGESHFDNMRGFFLGNGFERIIDQDDYTHPAFTGSWGVSDEDLFARADAEFRALHARGQPFFGLVFTSSNQDPFEFPDGRISLYEQPKQTRSNAAKYADYALGTFFDRATAAPYWNDTVFVVVADHDSRVFGADLVPIDNFHIPGLILGAGVRPRHDPRIVSQVDLGPTLLSLIGIGDATPMLGRDLNDPEVLRPGRAMMQYDHNFAWMQGDSVVVLQPGKPASGYRFVDHHLQPAPIPPGMARTALAEALWGSLAYDRHLYRLPPEAK